MKLYSKKAINKNPIYKRHLICKRDEFLFIHPNKYLSKKHKLLLRNLKQHINVY